MMRRPAIALVVAGICVGQGPPPASAGEIGGSVRSATSGELLPGVRVSLRSTDGSQSASRNTATGSGGDFRFGNLPAGQYTLQLRKDGIPPPSGRPRRTSPFCRATAQVGMLKCNSGPEEPSPGAFWTARASRWPMPEFSCT